MYIDLLVQIITWVEAQNQWNRYIRKALIEYFCELFKPIEWIDINGSALCRFSTEIKVSYRNQNC